MRSGLMLFRAAISTSDSRRFRASLYLFLLRRCWKHYFVERGFVDWRLREIISA
jgi:hypothetical protein